MNTILVTGGAGYVGSHACKALTSAGFLPVSFDNLSRGHRHAVKWGPLEVGDLLDPDALDRVFGVHRPVAVMHFAALAYVGESASRPLDYYRTNVQGTVNLLDAMRRAGCDKLVFSSTCAVYGNAPGTPIGEEQVQAPINPYGQSKHFAEAVLADADRAHGIRSVALRYFNAAGADPDGEIGEEHDPEPHLIPLALLTAAGRRAAIDIYGDDYPTPDGTCIRDYVHVCDLAQAHLLALRHLLAGGGSRHYNLGAGRGASVKEVIAQAMAITGRAIPVRRMPRRPGDPACLVADSTRIHAELGWRPTRSDLHQQITDAWAWLSRR